MEVKRKVTSAFLSLLHFFSASAFSSGNNYDSAEVVLEKSIIWQIRQCDRQSKRMSEKKKMPNSACKLKADSNHSSSFECTSNCRCRVAARICMPLTQLACLRYFAFLFTHFLLPGYLFPSLSLSLLSLWHCLV